MVVGNHCDWRHGCVFLIFYSWSRRLSRPVKTLPAEFCESEKKRILSEAHENNDQHKAMENFGKFVQECKYDERFLTEMLDATEKYYDSCSKHEKNILSMARDKEVEDHQLSIALTNYARLCRTDLPQKHHAVTERLEELIKAQRPNFKHLH
jgi:translation initiation factor 2 beta subunit (eIF-2beta)/eIF-5